MLDGGQVCLLFALTTPSFILIRIHSHRPNRSATNRKPRRIFKVAPLVASCTFFCKRSGE